MVVAWTQLCSCVLLAFMLHSSNPSVTWSVFDCFGSCSSISCFCFHVLTWFKNSFEKQTHKHQMIKNTVSRPAKVCLQHPYACLWKRQRLNVRNIRKLVQKSMHLAHVSHIQSVKLVRDQQAATKTHDLKMSTDNMYLEHMYHTQSVKLFRDQQAATKSHDLN